MSRRDENHVLWRPQCTCTQARMAGRLQSSAFCFFQRQVSTTQSNKGNQSWVSGPNTIDYKIGEIFGDIKYKIQSGYNLREIIDNIDELLYRSQAEKHELSALYAEKIKRMGNAGRNDGEYYTPRPLIRAIVRAARARVSIDREFTAKQQAFLDFVLQHYA